MTGKTQKIAVTVISVALALVVLTFGAMAHGEPRATNNTPELIGHINQDGSLSIDGHKVSMSHVSAVVILAPDATNSEPTK